MLKYQFYMKPMVITAPADASKRFIIGTQFGWIPYDDKTCAEVMSEWEAIQQAKLLEPVEQEEVFEVASKSDPSKKYKVTKKNGKFYCECQGFTYRHFCSHVESLGGKKNAS